MKTTLVPLVVFALVGCHGARGISKEDTRSEVTASSTTVTSATSPEKAGSSPSAGRAQPSAVDASKLRVAEGKSGLDPETGYLHILGTVTNDTGAPVESVNVTLDLFDASGAPIDVSGWHKVAQQEAHAGDKEHARGEIHYLMPGESTPYHYIRDPAKMKGKYASHRLTVSALPGASRPPTARIDGPTTQKVQGGFDEVTLKGTFVVGAAPCRSPKVYFGFYEGDKLVELVSPHKNALDDHFQRSVPAGTRIPFEGKSFPHAPAGASVRAFGGCDNWIAE
jgi:hypothetical protein